MEEKNLVKAFREIAILLKVTGKMTYFLGPRNFRAL